MIGADRAPKPRKIERKIIAAVVNILLDFVEIMLNLKPPTQYCTHTSTILDTVDASKTNINTFHSAQRKFLKLLEF